MDEPLHSLANRTNQAILGLLAVEASYPRRVASLLGLAETEVARRLKHMEGLGLVRSEWTRVATGTSSEGKNVKVYKLAAEKVSLRFAPDGVHVEISANGTTETKKFADPVLEQTPPGNGFVGRTAELKALAGPHSVVIVEGLNGIGKTSLLAEFAREHANGRAVYWHSFRGVESLTWLANQLAVLLGHRGDKGLLDAVQGGADLADLRERMVRAIDRPEHMLVFDETHRLEDEAVRGFLGDAVERVTKAKLLIGARERPRFNPTLSHVKVLRLGGLTDEDVHTILDRKGMKVPAALWPKVREEVGGHPIALNLLLETAKQQNVPVEALLDRVPEKDLQEWLLREVYAGLSDGEKEALAHASLFRTTFTSEDLAAVSRKNVDGVLFTLRRRLLVDSDGSAYSLHEVLRNFFYSLLHDKPALHAKLAAHYLTQGTQPSRLEAMHHYLRGGKRDKVLDLLDQDLDLHDFDYLGSGYQNLYLAILDQFPRSEVRDAKRWGLIEDERGDCWYAKGDPANALKHYEEALAVFRGKDKNRVADLAWKRGLCLQKLGKKADAKKAVQEGLDQSPEGVAAERLRTLRNAL